MRHAFRPRRNEEEEESVFISMTDMTVGFLFIVMILLAFFATQIAPGDTVPKIQLSMAEKRVVELTELLRRQELLLGGADANLVDELRQQIKDQQDEIDRLRELLSKARPENPIALYNARASSERSVLLRHIRDRVKEIDGTIDVAISGAHDALQFRGDGLFASGQWIPSPEGSAKMRLIAGILGKEIKCFIFDQKDEMQQGCNPGAIAIDAIQVEGHTDSDGDDDTNMSLGAKRGASIYSVMINADPDLLKYRNLERQPVMSVASYGEGRPIADDSAPGGKDANRRIDLRFIMFSPANEETIPLTVEDMGRVRSLLESESGR